MSKLTAMGASTPSSTHWRGKIREGPLTAGLEHAADSAASRSWIYNKPNGWTGRDYVRAIQLRSANLPTAGIPSNPPEQQRCRAGCAKRETICHVLQGCPATHWPRIRRHNEVVRKIGDHCKTKKWKTELEPHIRHPDGTLFKPDLVIHKPNMVIVSDVQVCWEGDVSLAVAHERKRATYNTPKFLEALHRSRPGLSNINFKPITIGARGIWPRANDDSARDLEIGPALKASCIHSTLKWGSTIHSQFGKAVWRRR